ncbi:MAG: bifunctional nuclease family protein [Elusimicrobiota bacterium]|nr:bifunctional nuclease family protein [Elusimicrobiota bacterium]
MKKEKKDIGKEIELKIYSIATSITESIIFLDESEGSKILPIWIGPMEAQAIAIRLSGFPSPRPMTHDLVYSVLNNLGYKIQKVKLVDVVKNTYYAMLYIQDASRKIVKEIDSRPSDAIAMAVRYGCPIYIDEGIMKKVQVLNKPITEGEVLKFKHELKNLKPKDIIEQLLNKKKRNPRNLKPKKKDKDDKKEDDTKDE